jgi:hypothetical protein
MPRVRESLTTTKTRLQADLKRRTDRRVRELLNRKEEDLEIFDDSEEADRLSARHARFTRDKATQTDRSSSLSFCCGVCGGVFLVACLIVCLLLFVLNDRQRVAQ